MVNRTFHWRIQRSTLKRNPQGAVTIFSCNWRGSRSEIYIELPRFNNAYIVLKLFYVFYVYKRRGVLFIPLVTRTSRERQTTCLLFSARFCVARKIALRVVLEVNQSSASHSITRPCSINFATCLRILSSALWCRLQEKQTFFKLLLNLFTC